MKLYLTVDEAALLVGKDRSRIYRWLRGGELKDYPRGDSVTRVNREELVALAASKKPGRRVGSARPPTTALPPTTGTTPLDIIARDLAALAGQLAEHARRAQPDSPRRGD